MGLQLKTPTLLTSSRAWQTQQATTFTQLLSFPSSRASKPCPQREMLCAFPICAIQRHCLGSRLPPGGQGAAPPAHPPGPPWGWMQCPVQLYTTQRVWATPLFETNSTCDPLSWVVCTGSAFSVVFSRKGTTWEHLPYHPRHAVG